MANFKMDTDALVDTATKIRILKYSIEQDFDKANNGVNISKKAYKSDAMNDYIAKYSELKPEIEKYTKAINDYSYFLEESADIVKAVDANLKDISDNITKNNLLSEWK